MSNSSSVEALNAYCNSEKTIGEPVYSISKEDKIYHCSVALEVLNEISYGEGRSKCAAKQSAATNMIKNLQSTHPRLKYSLEKEYKAPPVIDCIEKLRNMCISNDHPLPKIEIIRQVKSKKVHEFTALCSVATIKCFGISTSKKEAKQIAAQNLINFMEQHSEEAKNKVKHENFIENQNRNTEPIVKTYRELITEDDKDEIGTKIVNRHDYFKNLKKDLKLDAIKILDDSSISTDHERVIKFLELLNIKFNVFSLETITDDDLLCIEIFSKLDICFAQPEEKLWGFMITYFRDMMK